VERSVTANDEGRYKIIQLHPGQHTVRVSSPGSAKEEKTNITPVAGQNLQLDFTLRPADVTGNQVVVDIGEPPPVDTTRAVLAGRGRRRASRPRCRPGRRVE